jgi:hypothetical protein
MKRIASLFVFVLLGVFLMACEETEKVGVLTWTGLEEQVVIRGDEVDLLEGINVTDSIDGPLSSAITIKDDGEFSKDLADRYTVTYEVENSTGVVDTKTKDFIVQVGHNVANGSFELGAFGWTLDAPGGQATLAFTDNKANLTISNSGTAWWAIQLKQENVVFKANRTYKMTVTASSADGHSIAFGYEDPNNGFAMLNPGYMPVELSETSNTYEMYYTSTENYSNIKAVVYLGYKVQGDKVLTGQSHSVIIEKINIEEVTLKSDVVFEGFEAEVTVNNGTVSELDLLDGVTAKQGTTDLSTQVKMLGMNPDYVQVNASHFVQYVVEFSDGSVAFSTRRFNMTLEKEFAYQAVNGDFALGFTGWTQDVIQTQGNGQADFIDNADGTVSVKVVNPSDAAWHIQLQQADSDLEANTTYKVVVVIKADIARRIVLEIVDPANGFAAVGPTTDLDVTTEYQTFEVEFTTGENPLTNIKIGLLLGNTDGLQPANVTFTVDEFQVHLVTVE